MTTIQMIIGLFAGICLSIVFFYSLTQAMTREGNRQYANLAAVIGILVVMGLLFQRDVGAARVMAPALFAVGIWVFAVETGWNRVFPVLMQLFAVVLMLGWVALTPLPS
ncbi:MAG: hypothetical protein ACFBRM_02825 [Pikeienuella sp.]